MTSAFDRVPPRVLVLSSSLLTERMLLLTRFVNKADSSADLRIWSVAERGDDDSKGGCRVVVEKFPKIAPFRERTHNHLRRLNDFAWDARLRLPSRSSMTRHIRWSSMRKSVQALRLPGRAVAALGLEEVLERWTERVLTSYERSPEATRRLRDLQPDIVVTTGPHRYEEPAVVGSAKRLGIRTLALITSWDNLTTKNRMPFRHEGYLVWSEQMRRELHEYYPGTRDVPTYVVGAPQFDVFFQKRYRESRSDFCARVGLDPSRPFILYALGSPNLLKVHDGAVALAERLVLGELADVQMLVRPHPLFDNGEEVRLLDGYGPSVRVQRTGQAGLPVAARSQGEADIFDWVNAFRHADVVVNLASTATVDAAVCDRPIVNLDFDPEPGEPNGALIDDINHRWPHFKPVAESGGVWLVNDVEQMIIAIRTYLEQPDLHSEQRRWIAEYVCGYLDGRCGERLADAVLDFALRV